MLKFVMIETGAVPGVMKRDLNKVLKAAFKEAGEWWQVKRLPRHFTRKAISEYNYKPREGDRGATATQVFRVRIKGQIEFRRRVSYTEKKFRKFKHKLPLVWTGDSMRLSATGRVTATSRRFRVTVPAPTLNRRPHMREEVVRVTDQEETMMVNMINQSIRSAFNKSRKRVVKKLF